MPDDAHTQMQTEALLTAVSRMLGIPVIRASCEATPLHGGTLGDVRLVQGIAKTTDGRTHSYRIVLKTQKKWERPGDAPSWRREYDLYQTGLGSCFTQSFRQPIVYHAEMLENENNLWMEYIDGISGAKLTLDDLEQAAKELGRFQGRYGRRAEALRRTACLGDADYLRRDFAQWTADTVEYQYLRSENCALPQDVRQMLTETFARSEAIFDSFARLPQVLCHRDYWAENIFLSGGRVVVIDWDCAGFGAIGEDIASLIADETDASQIGVYYARLVPAYLAGLAEYMDVPPAEALPVRDMIILKFGYRLVQQVMFSRSPEARAEATLALEQIGEIRE